jgi:hypothetical protein
LRISVESSEKDDLVERLKAQLTSEKVKRQDLAAKSWRRALRRGLDSELTAEEVQQMTGAAGFTLISWNIEGLADDQIILRTQVAMRELLAQEPTLICLQEVVPETVKTIKVMLGGRYLDVEGAGRVNGDYFTKMFVQRASGLTVHAVSRERFNAGSRQGRDLLLVALEHKGTRVFVATSHLGTNSQKKGQLHSGVT